MDIAFISALLFQDSHHDLIVSIGFPVKNFVQVMFPSGTCVRSYQFRLITAEVSDSCLVLNEGIGYNNEIYKLPAFRIIGERSKEPLQHGVREESALLVEEGHLLHCSSQMAGRQAKHDRVGKWMVAGSIGKEIPTVVLGFFGQLPFYGVVVQIQHRYTNVLVVILASAAEGMLE